MSAQTLESISQKVIKLAVSHVEIPAEKVSLDSHFEADLGFDSLDMVEFVMLVEDNFDITVPDEEAQTIQTIRDAVHTIQKRIA